MPLLPIFIDDRGGPSVVNLRLALGATLPALRIQVCNGNDPVDLTGGVATFSMQDSTGAFKILGAAAVIEDATQGIVRYDWVGSDVNVQDIFLGQFQVVVGGKQYLLPTNADQQLRIIFGNAEFQPIPILSLTNPAQGIQTVPLGGTPTLDAVSRLFKIVVDESDFTDALTEESITLFNLPAGAIIQQMKMKHGEAFVGGGIAAFTLGIGNGALTQKYMVDFDVFTAPSSTNHKVTTSGDEEDHDALTPILLTAKSTGGDVADATAGMVEIWVLAVNPLSTATLIQASGLEVQDTGVGVAGGPFKTMDFEGFESVTDLGAGVVRVKAKSGGGVLGGGWRFDSAIADADPGSGDFRLNNATQSAATEMYISNISKNGLNASAILLLLSSGNKIYIQEESDPSRFHEIDVTGAPVDATTYVKIPIAVLESGSDLRNNRDCHILVFFAGSQNLIAGAGVSLSGDTLNVGDINRGVQVNADDVQVDANEIAGDGLQQLAGGGNEHILTLDLILAGGLKIVGGEVGVEPSDFAGDGLTDDGSDNLELDLLANGGLKIVGGEAAVEPADFAGAGLFDSGSDTMAIGDINRGVQVNADDVQVDASEIAGTGLQQVAGGGNEHLLEIDISAILAGNDTEVQYNDSGIFGSDSGFVTDKAGTVTLSTRIFTPSIVGGIGVGDELNLLGSSDAALGLINLNSPMRIGNLLPGSPLLIRAEGVFTTTAAYIGAVLQNAQDISIGTGGGVYIVSTVADQSIHRFAISPTFAVHTLLNASPVFENLGNFNLVGSAIVFCAPTHQRITSGTSTAGGTTGLAYVANTRTLVSGAVMTKTVQVGLDMAPKFSTVAGSTVNLGLISAVHCLAPAPGFLAPSAGTENMTAYRGIDFENITFGGSARKTVIHNDMTDATSRFLIDNVGGARSDFGGGNLLNVNNIELDGDGSISTFALIFGAGQDAAIFFDGTDLVVEPNIVAGANNFKVQGRLHVQHNVFPAILAERTGTATNLTLTGWRFLATTSADMVDGFGGSVFMSLKDSADVDNNVAYYSWVRNGADNSGEFNLFVYEAGVAGRVIQVDQAEMILMGQNNGVVTTAGGRKKRTTRITSGPYTVLASDHVIYADTDGGAFQVDLPAGIDGAEYRIINVGSSANSVTLNPNGAELLLGAAATTPITDGNDLRIVFETTEGWW